MSANIIIVTAGGLAREVYSWFSDQYNFVGFMDNPRHKHEMLFGLPVTLKKREDAEYVVATGDCKRKKQIVEELGDVKYCTLIHWSARTKFNRVGEGCVVDPFNTLGPEAILGKHVYMNVHAFVAHNVKIGDYCFIGPNAVVADYSSVGEGVFVGSNATIVHRAKVGDWSVVGAGAVVVKDVEPRTVVVGNPARPLREC